MTVKKCRQRTCSKKATHGNFCAKHAMTRLLGRGVLKRAKTKPKKRRSPYKSPYIGPSEKDMEKWRRYVEERLKQQPTEYWKDDKYDRLASSSDTWMSKYKEGLSDGLRQILREKLSLRVRKLKKRLKYGR